MNSAAVPPFLPPSAPAAAASASNSPPTLPTIPIPDTNSGPPSSPSSSPSAKLLPQFPLPLSATSSPSTDSSPLLSYQARLSVLPQLPPQLRQLATAASAMSSSAAAAAAASMSMSMAPLFSSPSTAAANLSLSVSVATGGKQPDNRLPLPPHLQQSFSEGEEDEASRSPIKSTQPVDSLEKLQAICEKSINSSTPPDVSPGGNGNSNGTSASNANISKVELHEDPEGMPVVPVYNCHLCPYNNPSREMFNEHLNGHYEFMCVKCDFVTKSEDGYRIHLKAEHDLTPEDLEDEQGVRVPKVNAQGKVKTFKCKHCEYVAVTKDEFWRHGAKHIKPEKRLGCPKCSFVTEFKHHLEYHLRNHYGTKPFRCKHCSYSCVNKSMLSSHMKSHQAIYQYRCKDCQYATKYCHSLKLHLRKYKHSPAMVLNPDGTPNPLPIIDVYGTRRGPKMKRGDDSHAFPMLPPHILAQIQKTNLQNPHRQIPPQHVAASLAVGGIQTVEEQLNLSGQSLDDDEDEMSRADVESVNSERQHEVQHLEDNQQQDVVSHMEDQEPLSMFKCGMCSFQTANKDIYDNHVNLHDSKTDTPSPATQHSNMTEEEDAEMVDEEDSKKQAKEVERNAISSNPTAAATTLDYIHNLQKMAPLLQHMQQQQQQQQQQHAGSAGSAASSHSPDLQELPLSASTSPSPELFHRWYLEHIVKRYSGGVTSSAEHKDKDEEMPEATANGNGSGAASALDLSSQVAPAGTDAGSQNITASTVRSTVGNGNSGGAASVASSGGGSSRRKGKAVRIKRKDSNATQDSSGSDSGAPGVGTHASSSSNGGDAHGDTPSSAESAASSANSPTHRAPYPAEPSLMASGFPAEYSCVHCRIAFASPSMYSAHSSLHSADDPMRCAVCGDEADDAEDFYAHILKKAHV